MKKYFIFLFLVLIIFGCKKPIKYGASPDELEENLSYQHDKLLLEEERIEMPYVITKWNVTNNPDNGIIFYLHGLGRNELEWVEKNGFGKMYYDTLQENSKYKSYPVVSISLGGTYLFLDNAPPPYNIDVEKVFINKIIPYFKKKLNCNGKVFLIGHSMGGYNALTISLRHPEIFPDVIVISPYVAPISPFTDKFDKKGEELKMPKLQVKLLKRLLTNAYKTEENWFTYNPFKLVEKNRKNPYIIMSTATNDLPGFEWSITLFDELLTKKNVPHYFCIIEGDHKSACKNLFRFFLDRISQ